MDEYSIHTTSDEVMEVLGVGKLDLLFPSREKPIVLILDRIFLVNRVWNVVFSPRVRWIRWARNSKVVIAAYPALVVK